MNYNFITEINPFSFRYPPSKANNGGRNMGTAAVIFISLDKGGNFNAAYDELYATIS